MAVSSFNNIAAKIHLIFEECSHNLSSFKTKWQKTEFKKEISIEVQDSNDNRSYHINSDKIFNVLGFKPNKNLEFAIKELCQKFKENKIVNPFSDDRFYNVKTLKKINAQ
jgi:dTDP-D-glucose 4,6-dehydratase